MSNFKVNGAGAKVYEDINKHELLPIPQLNSDREQGEVYHLLSAGLHFTGRTPIVSVKEGNEVVAYQLPMDLYEWVQSLMLQVQLNNIRLLPANVEFGVLNGTYYAEIL